MSPKPEDLDLRLRRLAADLPRETPPAALRTRILESLPTPQPAPPKPSHLRLIAVGLAACAAAALLLAGPHHNGLRSASAAEVHAAILRANTWHFVGWHLRDGQKVRWEVWGRRSPYFYREQIGSEVYLDDGTRSTHILPPDPKSGREHGVVLILPSQPRTSADSSTGTGEANLLVGIGGDADSYQRIGSAGPNETFTARTEYMGYPNTIKETAMLIADKVTHLPVHYVVSRLESPSKDKPNTSERINSSILSENREYTEAKLSSSYNVLLPITVADTDIPAGYLVTDANDSPPSLDAPAGSVFSQGGLTVRSEVLAQDADGNLRLRFYAWLGKQPLNHADTGLSLDGLLTSGRYGTDDRGIDYHYIHCPGTIGNEDGSVDLWLVPAEPYSVDVSPPRTINLNASLGLSRYERMGRSGRSIPVMTEPMTFHLNLPTQKQDLGFDALLAPSAHPGMTYEGSLPSLANEAAEARAECYLEQPVTFRGGKMVTTPNYGRAAYWFSVAAQAAMHTGDVQRAKSDTDNAATMQRMQQQSSPH